jgi:hypothetical protein
MRSAISTCAANLREPARKQIGDEVEARMHLAADLEAQKAAPLQGSDLVAELFARWLGFTRR